MELGTNLSWTVPAVQESSLLSNWDIRYSPPARKSLASPWEAIPIEPRISGNTEPAFYLPVAGGHW